jgi:hypothetical protein
MLTTTGRVIGMRITIRDRVAVAILAATIAMGTAGCTFVVGDTTSQATASDVTHCDGAVCTLDLSKSQTRELNANLNLASGGVATAGALCGLLTLISGPAGIIVPIICVIGVTFEGSFFLNAISRAAGDDGCLRIQFLPPVFHDDHSAYCH